MRPIHDWPSRSSLPQRRKAWRGVATALLPAVAVVACQDVAPTTAPSLHSLGTPSIFLINPDGTGLTQLTRGSSWSYNAAWKPRPRTLTTTW